MTVTHLSPAIRQDHQLSCFVFPLMFICWVDYRCPHCKHVFRRDYFPGKILLGNSEHTCSGCGKVFDHGSREWPELPFIDKFGFLFPSLAKVILGSILFLCAMTLLIAPRDQVNWIVVIAVLGTVLVPMLPWLAVRSLPIQRSIRRCRTTDVASMN